MRTLGLALVVLSCGTAACADQARSPDERLAGLAGDLEALRVAYGALGLAVSIVDSGRVVFAEGFGQRNVEQDRPVTPETLFPIASVTKQFTAALIGIYEGEGRLSVQDRPAAHLPDVRFYTSEMDEQVAMSHLLTHRSGVGMVDGTHVFFPTDDRTEHLRRLPHLRPSGAVGEAFAYSNMGYAILGAIAEEVSSQTWKDEIQSRIFQPRGMDRSSATVAALTSDADFALGYGMFDGRPLEVLYEDQHESGPSGAINSSVNDLSAWIITLLNGGMYQDDQVIPRGFVERALSPQTEINGPDDTYGYGWFVGDFEGHRRANHGGNVSGFTTLVDLLPERGIGVAVLINQQSTDLRTQVVDVIYRRLLGLPRPPIDSYPVRVSEATPITVIAPSDGLSNEALERFVGAYFNCGYGRLEVRLEDEVLYVAFPAFEMALEHEGGNVFRTVPFYPVHQNTPSFPITFSEGQDGSVANASIPSRRTG